MDLINYLADRREERKKLSYVSVFLQVRFPNKTHEEIYTAISQVSKEYICANPLISDLSDFDLAFLIPAFVKRLSWKE